MVELAPDWIGREQARRVAEDAQPASGRGGWAAVRCVSYERRGSDRKREAGDKATQMQSEGLSPMAAEDDLAEGVAGDAARWVLEVDEQVELEQLRAARGQQLQEGVGGAAHVVQSEGAQRAAAHLLGGE